MSITKAKLKEIRSLTTKKGRRAGGLFVAEGVRLLEEAIRFGYLPRTVYYASSLMGKRGEKLVREMVLKKVACLEISAPNLRAMAGTRTPQGMVGVFALPVGRLRELYRPQYRRLLWCDNVSDPGNMGTLIRSAAAFEFSMVITTGNSADVYSPKVVRSSAGAVFGLTLTRTDCDDVIEFAHEQKIPIVATMAGRKKTDYSLKKLLEKGKLILAIGGEADGLSSEVIENADQLIRIEHSNSVDSLNAAVAGSILMERLYSCREVLS